MKRVVAVSIFVLLLVACGNKKEPFNEISTPNFEATTSSIAAVATQTPEVPYQSYISSIYNDPAAWLCWPGIDDACERDLTTTVIYSDGTFEVISSERTSNPSVDCFYIYPTIYT